MLGLVVPLLPPFWLSARKLVLHLNQPENSALEILQKRRENNCIISVAVQIVLGKVICVIDADFQLNVS